MNIKTKMTETELLTEVATFYKKALYLDKALTLFDFVLSS